ncbi:hypothetical protein CRG98_002364 [Punica granatum]|uniref:Reverse transcriptase domain-containing protein n=1 Tax=Punica granatum TaxID=22663 RepID=A0A2I0L9A8_PUNGR|nr:hypothetical protein CRG98_002364 [Punica granatum]
MSHEHQQVASSECAELLQQDLIEPSNSRWACEAFYVNKWSKKIRDKLRLVINYQPLNHFLPDDKFPLPNKQALFTNLSQAKVFFKFDLKKAICGVFSPIMDWALIYIDNILLFSSIEKAHVHLLQPFLNIVSSYEIMLSEKKMVIGQKKIQFFGMKLANGQYQSEPHVALEILKYSEESLTKEQIQLFLGTVNYLRDFLPRIARLTCPLEKILKKDAPA